jgi:hypothetical protein
MARQQTSYHLETSAASQTISRQYEHLTAFVSKQSNGIILLPCNQWKVQMKKSSNKQQYKNVDKY